MNQKLITFIVSDLHLGGGKFDPGDDHVYKGDQFAKFILTRLVETNEWKNGDIELFINGDFLDFVQVGPELYDGNLDTGWCSENESLNKLKVIIKGHKPIFDALRTFNEKSNLITIAAGNHDVDLYWPAVQQKIIDTIGNTNFEIGEEIVSRYDGRLLIGHGHMDDPANKFKNWAQPVVKEKNSELPPRLEMCPGTKFMVKFVNLLEAKYPFADNIIPETNLARILWKEDKIGAVLAAALLFKFMGTEPRAFLGSSTSDKTEILKQIKDYLEVPNFLNEVTSIYNEVFNLHETEKAVKSKLKEDDELFQFVNAVFTNMSPEEWQPVFDKWPIKTTLSIHSNDATLSIGYAGISDIKSELREKAMSMLTENVDIVVYGHTHQPDKADFKVKKYFNPGSWTRYVDIKNIDSLTLEDLANESDFPYQLNYIKVWKDIDPNKKILQSEMITFEELLGTKFKATGNTG